MGGSKSKDPSSSLILDENPLDELSPLKSSSFKSSTPSSNHTSPSKSVIFHILYLFILCIYHDIHHDFLFNDNYLIFYYLFGGIEK